MRKDLKIVPKFYPPIYEKTLPLRSISSAAVLYSNSIISLELISRDINNILRLHDNNDDVFLV